MFGNEDLVTAGIPLHGVFGLHGRVLAVVSSDMGSPPAMKSAGGFGELNATDPGGIDLYLEHKDLLIGGKPGRAIAIIGSIPGPIPLQVRA